MSDIQEEQKRLYKRAEENDKEKWIDISKENRRLLKEIHNREINELQDRINKLKKGLLKILELNKFMVNCESEKVRMKTIMKQYSLIYEILGIPEPGLARGTKNNLDKEK